MNRHNWHGKELFSEPVHALFQRYYNKIIAIESEENKTTKPVKILVAVLFDSRLEHML